MNIKIKKNNWNFYCFLTKSVIFKSVTFLILGFLISCNGKKVKVEKLPPLPLQVKTYSILSLQENPILLNDNTSFLWKNDGNLKDQVKTVQILSSEIEHINKKIKEVEKPLNILKKYYQDEISQLNDSQKNQWEKLPTLEIRTQNSLNSNLQKFNNEKQTLFNEYENFSQIIGRIDSQKKLLDEELSKPTPDKDILENLNKSLTDLNIEKNKSLQKIESLKKNLDTINEKITKANEVLNQIQTDKTGPFKKVFELLQQIKIEEERINPEKETLTKESNEKISLLRDQIDPMESPSKLVIYADQNQVQIKLDWIVDPNCLDCQNSFSTEDGTIKNLVYMEKGGVLDFEFKYSNFNFTVHLVRSEVKSDEDDSSRIAYSGDFIRSEDNKLFRKGVLKLLSGK